MISDSLVVVSGLPGGATRVAPAIRADLSPKPSGGRSLIERR
jgi:hypothetical protein